MMWVEKVGSDIVLCVCEVGCWSVDMVLVYVVEFDMDGLEKLFVDVCVLEVLGGQIIRMLIGILYQVMFIMGNGFMMKCLIIGVLLLMM